MLDGAAVATVADAALTDSIENELDAAAAQLAAPDDERAVPGDYVSHVAEFNDYNSPALSLNEIVFIDSSVPDAANFLTHVSATAEVYFIDTSTDGVDQIADILRDRSDIDALHIVSHGDQGSLELGSSVLNHNTMESEYATELAMIGGALSDHGDILIYGCDFAAGPDGSAAAALLADLTGAEVAASTDDTGAAAKGGDWDLEHQTGTVEALSLIHI